MIINYKKLHPDAVAPKYAHAEDAGFDLCALETVTLQPGERATIPTGLAIAIPPGYVGLIWDKGGISHKGGIKSLGGVLDTGYTGDVSLGVVNLSDKLYTFEKGHKVGQMIIQEKITAELTEVDDIGAGDRGEKRFGSTGK